MGGLPTSLSLRGLGEVEGRSRRRSRRDEGGSCGE